jgi:hypothetical protein
MSNPKFKAVFYPSQNSTNKAHRPVSGSYDVYIPGTNVKKVMMTEAQIRTMCKSSGANMQGHGSFRHTPNGNIIFRSTNIADIETAAETQIGWHLEKIEPNITIGKKAYIIPTYSTMKANAANGVFPVIEMDITDTPQTP